MNVTVSVTEFQKELELLCKSVAQKPTIPVLANILVQAEGSGLRLAATDLETGLVTFCPAIVNAPGSVTLPAKHLLDIVKLLSGELTLTLDKTVVKLSSARYTSRLQTYPAIDYPAMPSIKDLQTVSLPAATQDMIRRVRFAVSEKDRRYFMDGAMLTFAEGRMALAATDSHRLAYAQCLSDAVSEPVIIPSKTLDKLSEMLVSEAFFAIGSRHTFYVMDGRMLFSRMVEGKFPSYERIIPRDTDQKMDIPRLDFLAALQRSVLTSTETTLYLVKDLLTASGKDVHIGDAIEQVQVRYDGPDTVITLNGAYLLDFLNAATSPTVTVQWKTAGPLMFTDGTDYCYVQMPMRNM
jgi:DNA polymerase-3 subunit beta